MKKIIIDGVNVSECEYYNKDDKTCREVNGKYETDICDFDKCENSNCYYKQLKRLEQENERLKEEFTSFMNGDYCAESCKKMNNAFQDVHKGILKENEKLKNILTNIDKKLELALNVEQTDAEESFDLLYEIQDIITKVIGGKQCQQ